MKISKIVYKSIFLIIIFIMSNSCISYAISPNTGISLGTTTTGLPTIGEGYRPTVSDGKATEVVEAILGILTVLGALATVISIALIGFSSILGSASQKAASQEKYVGIFIAALLMTGGSIIAKMIISVAEKI